MGKNGFQEGSKLAEEFNNKQKELINIMRNATIEIKQLQQEIINNNASIADKVVSAIKSGYQKALELEKSAAQQRIKAAEDEHKAKIKLLDDWLQHHNSIIDEMLRDLEKLYATEDYEEELNRLTQERSEAERALQIALNLSDDAVDKDLRVKEARENLDKIDKKIQETMRDRARKLRKEELEEIKRANEESVNSKKNAENQKLESVKLSSDEEIRIIEAKYDRLINDEEMYARIREDIMNGSFTRAETHITRVLDNLRKHNYSTVYEMNQSWQQLENTINSVIAAQKSLSQILDPNSIKNIGSSYIPDYGNDGIEPYEGYTQINELRLLNEPEYVQKEIERTKKVINDRLKAGMDVSKQKKYLEKLLKLPKFHTGGIVGDGNPSDKLNKIVNELFNTKPNETIVKSLIGELQIPPQNIKKNFIPNITNMAKLVSQPSINNIQYDIKMYLSNISGGIKGGKEVFNEFVKELRNAGGRI